MEPLIRHKLIRSNHGFAVVLLIMILVIATAIGVWGLRSSQDTLRRIGVRRTVTELKYEAEKGLQKAVLRIQSIADDNPATLDNIATLNGAANGVTGGEYDEKPASWLLGIPTETGAGANANPACGTFDPKADFDIKNKNVVCNFLGMAEPNIHVSLVRKDDVVEPGLTFAIYLINAIAYDSAGRRQISQGVVVVPYAGTASTGTPYLSNSKTVSD